MGKIPDIHSGFKTPAKQPEAVARNLVSSSERISSWTPGITHSNAQIETILRRFTNSELNIKTRCESPEPRDVETASNPQVEKAVKRVFNSDFAEQMELIGSHRPRNPRKKL